MAVAFAVGAVNIQSQNTNCNVSFGVTQLPGWAAQRKVNNGEGFFAGAFINTANGSILIDTDAIDGVINNLNNSPSVQTQAV